MQTNNHKIVDISYLTPSLARREHLSVFRQKKTLIAKLLDIKRACVAIF